MLIETEILKYILISYTILVLISSFIGNLLVLIASLPRYKAFNLPQPVVVGIRHVAVYDILYSVVFVFPLTISIFNGGKISPAFWHVVLSLIQYPTYFVGSITLCFVNVLKLSTVKFPYILNRLSTRTVHKMIALLWVLLIITDAIFCGVNYERISQRISDDDFKLDFPFFPKPSNRTTEPWLLTFQRVLEVSFATIYLITIVIAVIAAIFLVVEAQRIIKKGPGTDGDLHIQGVVVILVSCTIYFISNIPIVIYNFYCVYNFYNPDGRSVEGLKPVRIMLPLLNILSNFYISNLSQAGFRDFINMWVKTVMLKIAYFCSNKRHGQCQFNPRLRRITEPSLHDGPGHSLYQISQL